MRQVQQTYLNADGVRFALRYVTGRNGSHTVVVIYPGDAPPDVYRFGDVESARRCWRTQVQMLRNLGFNKEDF